MRRHLVGWTIAFVLVAGSAGGLLWATLRNRHATPPATLPPSRRDPRSVSDVELELILNKIREGDLQAMKGDMDAARRAWREARRMGEGLWPVHEGLADSYARMKLHDEALAEYLVAEPLVPENLAAMRGMIVFKRAGVQALLGRYDEAFLAYLGLDQPEALGGRLLEIFEKTPNKLDLLKAVRDRAATRDPRLHLLDAILSEKLGQKTDAARALARFAITCAPWDRAVTGRAIALLRAEKLVDDAVEVCRAWAKAEPGAIDAYRAMGDLLREAGREQEAYVAYTSIVDVRPGDADAHRTLGKVFLEMKRYDDAIAQFEKSKAARPEEPERWIDVAEAWALKGDGEKSAACYAEIGAKKWDGRFGNVVASIKQRMAQAYLTELEAAKKAGKKDRVQELRRLLGECGVPEHGTFDVKVIMTWDTQTDIDMDVVDPNGETVNHQKNASKAGGCYYVDNTRAYGPETYTLAKAPAGTYKVGAHFHSGSGRTTAKFTVILYEDTPKESRQEFTIVFEKSGEQKWVPEITIK